MSEVVPRIAVLVFPGSNDDRDAAWALTALGAEPARLARGRGAPRVDAVVLPGGFSYGDYLRCGAIARFSPAMQAGDRIRGGRRSRPRDLQRLPDPLRGAFFPGVLRPNASLEFVCADVPVRVERTDTPFTSRCEPGQELVIPVKHGEGCYHAPADLDDEQIVFRYARGANPNGSARDIAGVANTDGNVLGLMPHPEHAVDPLLGSGDGALVLASLVDAARERLYARA